MDIPIIYEFIAHGEIIKDGSSVPATIVGKYLKYGLGDVQCKVSIESLPSNFDSLFDHQNPISLKGRTEEGKDIWSSDFHITDVKRGFFHSPSAEDRILLEGITTFFIEGDLSIFDALKGETYFIISVTPTALSLHTNGYYIRDGDGTITRKGEERQGIRWNTKLGEAELIDNYEYINEKIGFEDALVQIRKCQIMLNVTPHSRAISLKDLFTELEDILDEPLLIISLLSRKSVTWYAARASFLSKDYEVERHRDAIARRQHQSSTDINNLQFNLPVHLQALKEEAFQVMLRKYDSSPLKNTIRQTIQYLLVSYERGYFEARLGLVYAALETLIDGLSKYHNMTYLMRSNQFKKLSKELEEAIFCKLNEILEDVIQKKVSDEEIAKGIIGKLPELRRPPIRERLLKLLEMYKLSKIRMRSDLSTALEGILERRNHYIHQGIIDYDKQVNDFYLLQELIELWLLTLVDCPDVAINPTAFRHIIFSR